MYQLHTKQHSSTLPTWSSFENIGSYEGPTDYFYNIFLASVLLYYHVCVCDDKNKDVKCEFLFERLWIQSLKGITMANRKWVNKVTVGSGLRSLVMNKLLM